jgi:membrane peptidoglycan carboxypeptidase
MKYSIGIMDSKKRVSPPNGAGIRPSLYKYSSFKRFSPNNMNKKKNNNASIKGIRNKIDTPFKKKVKKAFYVFVGICFFIGCIALVLVGLYLKNLQNSLPSPDQLVERSSDQSTQIFDKNGGLLYTIYGEQNREFVSIDKIPEHTKWALLAAEDIEFYQHKGVDYAGIARAVIQNLTAGPL